MRVLVIDDEKAVRELLTRILKGAGHEVDRAASAIEALSYLRSCQPDLILLDIGMPGISGHQLVQLLSNDSDLFDIPVAVVSGRADPLSKSYARINGCVGYVEKPFEPGDILDLIHELEGGSDRDLVPR